MHAHMLFSFGPDSVINDFRHEWLSLSTLVAWEHSSRRIRLLICTPSIPLQDEDPFCNSITTKSCQQATEFLTEQVQEGPHLESRQWGQKKSIRTAHICLQLGPCECKVLGLGFRVQGWCMMVLMLCRGMRERSQTAESYSTDILLEQNICFIDASVR